jgi:anti-anti-sigma factor
MTRRRRLRWGWSPRAKWCASSRSASLTSPTVSVLEDQVGELLAVGFEQLIIDLRGLSFMDVSGLRLLLSLARHARHEGWRLSLIQGSVPVRRLFTLTDTARRLPFSPVAIEPHPDKHHCPPAN